ncbi:hypothetical protein ACI79P_19975 [Blastococcus sp. SYSU DS0510]
MTTSIARHGDRTADAPAAARAGERFVRSLVSVGAIVVDAIEATRGMTSAHTGADRRAVLDRFAADIARDGNRSAA